MPWDQGRVARYNRFGYVCSFTFAFCGHFGDFVCSPRCGASPHTFASSPLRAPLRPPSAPSPSSPFNRLDVSTLFRHSIPVLYVLDTTLSLFTCNNNLHAWQSLCRTPLSSAYTRSIAASATLTHGRTCFFGVLHSHLHIDPQTTHALPAARASFVCFLFTTYTHMQPQH
jgi:hypothetical protein